MPKPEHISKLEFDRRVARYYSSKCKSCAERGIAFNLNLVSVKNLMKSKKCFYTGITLTVPSSDPEAFPRLTDFSIDRVDSAKPYEPGNVVASSYWANQLKSKVEGAKDSGTNLLGFIAAEKVIKKTIRHMKKEHKKCVPKKPLLKLKKPELTNSQTHSSQS